MVKGSDRWKGHTLTSNLYPDNKTIIIWHIYMNHREENYLSSDNKYVIIE